MATLDERIFDGDQARQVLDNPAFARAFADIQQEYMSAWLNSPARDTEGREKIFEMVKQLDKVQATLRTYLETGKLASLELEHQKNLLTRQRAEDVPTGSW